MKTPFEIKNGLEICPKGLCEACPYPYSRNCQDALVIDALAYIQQLEAELAAVKRERDAAVYDVSLPGRCSSCKTYFYNNNGVGSDGPSSCVPCEYKWRGVCQENTEVKKDEKDRQSEI